MFLCLSVFGCVGACVSVGVCRCVRKCRRVYVCVYLCLCLCMRVFCLFACVSRERGRLLLLSRVIFQCFLAKAGLHKREANANSIKKCS